MRKTCSATSSCPNKVLKIEPTKQKKNTALRSVVRSLYNLVCDITIIESFANRIKQTNKKNQRKRNTIQGHQRYKTPQASNSVRYRFKQFACSNMGAAAHKLPFAFHLLSLFANFAKFMLSISFKPNQNRKNSFNNLYLFQ